MRYGDTTVLSTAVMSKKMATADFSYRLIMRKNVCSWQFPGL
ncbi:MAG: hypothetical protein ACLS3V_04485 [Streptococcus sp.]